MEESYLWKDRTSWKLVFIARSYSKYSMREDRCSLPEMGSLFDWRSFSDNVMNRIPFFGRASFNRSFALQPPLALLDTRASFFPRVGPLGLSLRFCLSGGPFQFVSPQ